MIPKLIHYCWFGRGEKPKLAQKCIESWKKYCPDYQIIEWNEDNFDVNSNLFVKQAYENKKFAFVTDYVRLFVMYKYGGIYMDTDVEVIGPIDGFLENKAFSGFETDNVIPTGIMASEKGFSLFEYLLSHYENKPFIKSDGSFDTETNVVIITSMLRNKGFVPNGQYQIIDGFTIYPKDFFCPYEPSTGLLEKTNNTTTIHWFSGSWMPYSKRIRMKIAKPFHRVFGKECFQSIKRILGEK